MPYSPPKYPSEIPTAADLPDRVDDVDWLYAARYNELKKELRAALTELGTLPKGASADVKTRLGLLALKASPVFTGQATIPTINLTGGQIKFPATAVPSADPNTQDEYEEGYHVATITCVTSGTITLNSNYNMLAYTKIGRTVVVSGGLAVSAVNSPLGEIRISLPFTATDLTKIAEFTTGSVDLQNVNLGADCKYVVPLLSSTASYVALSQIRDNTSRAKIEGGAFVGNEWIIIHFEYAVE